MDTYRAEAHTYTYTQLFYPTGPNLAPLPSILRGSGGGHAVGVKFVTVFARKMIEAPDCEAYWGAPHNTDARARKRTHTHTRAPLRPRNLARASVLWLLTDCLVQAGVLDYVNMLQS